MSNYIIQKKGVMQGFYSSNPHIYCTIKKVGWINQAPTEDEPNPHHINQPPAKLNDGFDELHPCTI
jgi:hypothetical protein